MTVMTKPARRLRRRRRVRAKVHGTAERPRISVFRSNRGIFAQLIDDGKGHTVAAVNWIEPDLRKLTASEQAKRAGELLAERAKAMSAYIFVAVGGGSIGLLVGGLITQAVNWHWIFFVNIPIGAVTLLLGFRSDLPSSPPSAMTGPAQDAVQTRLDRAFPGYQPDLVIWVDSQTPATARESMAALPISAYESARNSSPKPSSRFSRRPATAS